MIIDNSSAAGYVAFRHALDAGLGNAPDGLPIPVTIAAPCVPMSVSLLIPDDVPMIYFGATQLEATILELLMSNYNGFGARWFCSSPGMPPRFRLLPADPETPGDPVPEPAAYLTLTQEHLDAVTARLLGKFGVATYADLLLEDADELTDALNEYYLDARDLAMKNVYVYAQDIDTDIVECLDLHRAFYEAETL